MILKRFRLNSRNRKIDDLYGAIVAQSRCATFYTGYGACPTRSRDALTSLSCT